MLKKVRICKAPYIREIEDQGGRPSGRYEVCDVQGEVDEDFWKELKEFESYGKTPESKAEIESIEKQISNGTPWNQLVTPILNRLHDTNSTGAYRTFNLETKPGEYCRAFATFSHNSLREWTPEHDQQVARLKNICEQLNESKQ